MSNPSDAGPNFDGSSHPNDANRGWEAGIEAPAENVERSVGAETEAGTMTAGEPGHDVPEPSTLPPETDPTGAGWWRVLSALTVVAVAGFLLWPLLEPILAVSDVTVGTQFETAGALFALAPLVFLFLVRFVALPVALWRDATLLREADVEWDPDRSFYMFAGAVWASLTCAYYLYKRSRYTGRPRLPISDERLHFSGRKIPSNWHLVVAVAILLAPLASGLNGLMTVAESAPGGDVIAAVFAIIVLLLLVVRFLFLPVAFYRDSTAVRDADVDWQPATWVYVIVGYLFALPAGAYYLYKRSKIETL